MMACALATTMADPAKAQDSSVVYGSLGQTAAQTNYTYDALGRIASQTQSDGTVIAFSYDAMGNRTVQNTSTPTAPTLTALGASVESGSQNNSLPFSVGGGAAFTLWVQNPTPAGGSATITGNASGTGGTISYSAPTGGFAGTDTFTYKASNGGGSATNTVTVSVAGPLIITTPSLPAPIYGKSYSQPVSTTGGIGSITFSASGLPPGITIDSTSGLISGTTTTAGTFNFVVTAHDTNLASTSRSYTNETVVGPPTFTTASLPSATLNLPYSATVSATGGTGPLTYSANSMPSYLQINSTTGVISGTPNALGTVNFTAVATDQNGVVGSRALSLTVNPPPPIATAFTAPSVPFASSNNSVPLQVSGLSVTNVTATPGAGTASVSTSYSSSLGTWIATFTPTNPFYGNASFSYAATNAGGSSTPATVTVPVGAAPNPTANDYVNNVKSTATLIFNPITASNDTDPNNLPLSIISITQPSSGGGPVATLSGNTITFDPGGIQSGTYHFTYTISNGYGGTQTGNITITVTCPKPCAPA